MRRGEDKILVSHVGALPAPLDIWGRTDIADVALTDAVAGVVALRKEAGVDFINEGELTKGGNCIEFVARTGWTASSLPLLLQRRPRARGARLG